MRVRSEMVGLIGVMFLLVASASAHKGMAWGTKASWGAEALQREVNAEQKRVPVKVTAYSATPQETDADPYVTAAGTWVRRGIVALSRDLEKELRLKFGDQVILEGIGMFVFEDRMGARKKRQADLYMQSRGAARRFGVKETHLIVVRNDVEG